jgi:hypothetical protein
MAFLIAASSSTTTMDVCWSGVSAALMSHDPLSFSRIQSEKLAENNLAKVKRGPLLYFSAIGRGE